MIGKTTSSAAGAHKERLRGSGLVDGELDADRAEKLIEDLRIYFEKTRPIAVRLNETLHKAMRLAETVDAPSALARLLKKDGSVGMLSVGTEFIFAAGNIHVLRKALGDAPGTAPTPSSYKPRARSPKRLNRFLGKARSLTRRLYLLTSTAREVVEQLAATQQDVPPLPAVPPELVALLRRLTRWREGQLHPAGKETT